MATDSHKTSTNNQPRYVVAGFVLWMFLFSLFVCRAFGPFGVLIIALFLLLLCILGM